MKNILVFVSFMTKRPSAPENNGILWWIGRNRLGIKLEGGICGENVFQQEISLLSGELVGKDQRVRQ